MSLLGGQRGGRATPPAFFKTNLWKVRENSRNPEIIKRAEKRAK
jgi:hypothetical protein